MIVAASEVLGREVWKEQKKKEKDRGAIQCDASNREARVTGMRRRFFRECGGGRVAVKAKVG